MLPEQFLWHSVRNFPKSVGISSGATCQEIAKIAEALAIFFFLRMLFVLCRLLEAIKLSPINATRNFRAHWGSKSENLLAPSEREIFLAH